MAHWPPKYATDNSYGEFCKGRSHDLRWTMLNVAEFCHWILPCGTKLHRFLPNFVVWHQIPHVFLNFALWHQTPSFFVEFHRVAPNFPCILKFCRVAPNSTVRRRTFPSYHLHNFAVYCRTFPSCHRHPPCAAEYFDRATDFRRVPLNISIVPPTSAVCRQIFPSCRRVVPNPDLFNLSAAAPTDGRFFK